MLPRFTIEWTVCKLRATSTLHARSEAEARQSLEHVYQGITILSVKRDHIRLAGQVRGR